MLIDRSVRSLSSLDGASTSRVLNLRAIAQRWREDEDHRSRPLFLSPVLNSAFVLKHRLRADETYLFDEPRIIATKIIVPFDPRDLRMGGRSCFVGQRGFNDALVKMAQCKGADLDRDRMVLSLIDKVPSLDPFLLREHLKAHQIIVANCYFEISPSDQAQMHEFASQHLSRLISLAGGGGGSHEFATSKLVSALLSNQVDEKLEPLQLTLMLNDNEFREGVFCWRGFLFYKWSMSKLWPEVRAVLQALQSISPLGHATPDQTTYLRAAKSRILEALRTAGRDVTRSIRIYEEAYEGLVSSGKPKSFRDFLLSAPRMFLELGENMAGISHVTSFWRYRFPQEAQTHADAAELCAIFQDFESGFPLAHFSAEEEAV